MSLDVFLHANETAYLVRFTIDDSTAVMLHRANGTFEFVASYTPTLAPDYTYEAVSTIGNRVFEQVGTADGGTTIKNFDPDDGALLYERSSHFVKNGQGQILVDNGHGNLVETFSQTYHPDAGSFTGPGLVDLTTLHTGIFGAGLERTDIDYKFTNNGRFSDSSGQYLLSFEREVSIATDPQQNKTHYEYRYFLPFDNSTLAPLAPEQVGNLKEQLITYPDGSRDFLRWFPNGDVQLHQAWDVNHKLVQTWARDPDGRGVRTTFDVAQHLVTLETTQGGSLLKSVVAPSTKGIGEMSGRLLLPNSLVSHDGAGLITNDGGSLISNDGGSLIGNDGAGLVSTLKLNLVSHDGGGLLPNKLFNVISNDGASLIGNDGAGLVGKIMTGLITNDGGSLVHLTNLIGNAVGNPGLIAQGGGNLVAQLTSLSQNLLVASGGGNLVSALVATGGGNFHVLGAHTPIEGLVGRYLFDDPANLGKDSSGRGSNELQAFGGATYSGGALKLDGTGFLSTADGSAPVGFPVGSQPYTISAMIKTSSSTTGRDGSENLVNSTVARDQYYSKVTPLADGGYMVAWQDGSRLSTQNAGYEIRAQRYNADGLKNSAEYWVNATHDQNQTRPDVAALSAGGWVTVWQHEPPNFDLELKGQRFGADGVAVGDEFHVIAPVADTSRYQPAVAALHNGGFVVAFGAAGGDADSGGILAGVFGSDGVRTALVPVNTTTANSQESPSVAGLSDGKFVVTWVDHDISSTIVANGIAQTGDLVRAQVFTLEGVKSGGEILVAGTAQKAMLNLEVLGLSDGRFTVVYVDDVGATEILRGQVFEQNGSKVGNEFTLGATDALAHNRADHRASLAPLGNGFVVIWVDDTTANGDDISVQAFDPNGVAVGTKFIINTHLQGDQGDPSIASLGGGRFAVTWTDRAQAPDSDAQETSIRSQIVEIPLPRADQMGIVGWGDYSAGATGSSHVVVLTDGTGRPGLTPGTVDAWWNDDLYTPAPTVFDGLSHNVAVTYDGTHRVTYLDGKIISVDQPVAPDIAATNFAIGRADPLSDDFFTGTLDNVTIFSNALTAAEVNAVMRGGSGPLDQPQSVKPVSDFGGDGMNDVVFQNPTTKQVYDIPFIGGVAQPGFYLTDPLPTLRAVDTGDVGTAAGIVHGTDEKSSVTAELFLQAERSGPLPGGIYMATHSDVEFPFQVVAWSLEDDVDPNVQTTSWSLVGVADIDGDGNVDPVIQSDANKAPFWAQGAIYYMPMAEDVAPEDRAWKAVTYDGRLQDTVDSDYRRVVGLGDLNGDGFADVVVRNPDDGKVFYYDMHEGETFPLLHDVGQGALALFYEIVGVGDVNGDGHADVVAQLQLQGPSAANGVTIYADLTETNPANVWKQITNDSSLRTSDDHLSLYARDVLDLNNDGFDDVVFQDPATGVTVYRDMNPITGNHFVGIGMLPGWDVI